MAHGHPAGDVPAALRADAAASGSGSGLVSAVAARIATALAPVLVVVDPGRFVLAGDVGLAGGPTLAAAVRAQLGGVFGSLGVPPPDVTVSAAGEHPIRAGLATVVQQHLRDAVLTTNRRGTRNPHPAAYLQPAASSKGPFA